MAVSTPPWNPVDNYVLFNDVNIANNRRAVGSMDRDIEAVAEMGCADVRTSTLHAIVTSWERGRVDHHVPCKCASCCSPTTTART